MARFRLRWAQLDLARQMENMQFIREFIDLLGETGYNGLFLYLEDRIGIPSLGGAAAPECYTPEEIGEIVAYAGERGLEVIPCVATLGHAERFLARPHLADLAEVRDGMTGRFGGGDKEVFCLTHPRLYEFLDRCLGEAAELFPSPWFHAGLDEFYDFNLCPRCRAAMPDRAAEAEMFLAHILKVRAILARHGKRMMMWSDMFEFYPEILPRVPADVVMVDWQYQRDVRDYRGHLLDGEVEDRFAVHAACGHEMLAAPADRTLWNSQSFWEYADGREGVLGGLFTSWEKNDTYLYRSFPAIAASGFQMNGMERGDAFRAALEFLFGSAEPLFAAAVEAAIDLGNLSHFNGIRENRLLTIDHYGLKVRDFTGAALAHTALEAARPRLADERARRCFDDLLAAVAEHGFANRAQKITQDIFTFGATPARLEDFAAFRSDYARHLDRLEARWSDCRAGIEPNAIAQRRVGPEKTLAELEKRLATGNWCCLSGSLPDGFGVENLKIEYRLGGVWREAGCGVFKPLDEYTALFSRYFPLPDLPALPVEAVRLSAWGLGGTGVTFVKLRCGGRTFVPVGVAAVSGRVRDSAALLREDTACCWFGGQSTREDYFDRDAAQIRHGVELVMAEKSLPKNP